MRDEIFETPLSLGGLTSTTSSPTAPVEWLRHVQVFLPDTSSTPSLNLTRTADWVLEAVTRLEALGALQHGWDSYGGHPLSPEARAVTVRALRWLDKEDLPTPSVVLGSGGTVQWNGALGGGNWTLTSVQAILLVM